MTTPKRSTADIVIIVLTVVISIVVLIAITGLILLEIYRPDADIKSLAQRIGTITSQLIGVIVGYIAGKGSKSE